jgi:Domain of unknown function (DUF4350)
VTAPAGAGGQRRGWRTALVVVGLVVVTGTAAVLAQPRSAGGVLDPASAAPDGARALAQVLGRHGVRVARVERVEDAAGAATSGTTLLVVDGDVLAPDRLERLAATAADLVLVEPDAPVLAALAPDLAAAGTADDEVRPAGCPDADARAAGSALAGGHLVRRLGRGGTLCFADTRDRDAASYAVTSAGGRPVTVVGQGGVLANRHLAQDGNAALALRTLGAHPEVVWLMASPLDRSGDAEVSPTDLLPPWVPWAVLQTAVVAVLAMAWRARRLGRLVPEPLPVVVRSAETVEGRARLYRNARASAAAYEALRAGALARLLPAIGLGGEPDYRAVVEVVAARSGRPADEVHALLYGPPPTDDAGLVTSTDLLDTVVENTLDPTHVETAQHRLDGEGRPQ